MKSTYELIATKRDGGKLSTPEIQRIVEEFTAGKLPDYQMSALLMAAFLKGLDSAETTALTKAMLDSGKTVEVPDLDRPLIDKHSTGGVGDKFSLTISPLLAGMGVAVGMFSGRGLGHTGGTLDKLEAIPGMQVFLTTSRFRALLKQHHFAIMGQTKEIAPADKKIYALRDATGTVESIPLIVASIMSKKLALKSNGIVFDVKTGNGAFMKSPEEAAKLAKALLQVCRHNALPARALLTNMSQPTGRMVGNFLEVIEAVEILQGSGPEDSRELTNALSVEILKVAGDKTSAKEVKRQLEEELQSGRAFERFASYVRACKGDVKVLEKPSLLLGKAHKSVVRCELSGYITGFATARLGYLGIMLGAGRQKADDRIDPVAGFELHRKIGDKVDRQTELITVYGSDRARVAEVAKQVRDCFKIEAKQSNLEELILKRM